MILSTCCGSHGCHVSQARREETVADERPNIRPEQARSATICQPLVVGEQHPLPGAHAHGGEAEE